MAFPVADQTLATPVSTMSLAPPSIVRNESNAPVVTRGDSAELGDRSAGVTSDHSFTIREINDLDALERYAAAWNRLLQETPGASYFHSYDWFATYWRHYGTDQRMRVMLVLDDGRLAGIVPLVVARDQTRLGRLRSLRYPLHGWGSFYGPIGRDPRLLLRHALANVLTGRRDWDLIDMLWVDRNGADQGATPAAIGDLRLATRASAWLQSAQIELTAGWQAYWSSRRTHFRTNIRRCQRRLEECGEVLHIRYRPLGTAGGDCDPRWDLYDACEQIAAESWQGSSTTGTTMSHESVRAYLRTAHAAAVTFGGLDLNLLFVGGRPAAFAYNYQFAGYVYGLRAGFDANACPAGAGSVLMRRMVEDSCARGDRVIDLGPGSLDSKRHWQTRMATAWRYTHYTWRSPRAQILRALHAVKSLWTPAASALL
jgi:CelD/BcsL family acetyltransferase involved in cellulose biosynthesis